MEATQQRLLDTAAQLFAQGGYAGVSMRDIAREVGITQAAIYHHFPNKDALYIAALSYLFEQHMVAISEQLVAEEGPEDRLELLVGTMLKVLDEDPRFQLIYSRELLQGDERKLAAMAENAFVAFYEPVYALMAELAPGSDPQLLIFSLVGMIFHHLEVRKLAPHLPHTVTGNTAIPALTRHISRLFLHGIKQI